MAAVNPSDLIDSHYEALYRYAYRLSGTAADAEDLTQETYRRALARLEQLREPGKARGWLYRILRNAYLQRVQQDQRLRVTPLDYGDDLPDRNGEAFLPIDSSELQAALNDLEESFRTPLILYYFEELSYRDIAEQLDVPMGTVMSRLSRAKAYLRSRLLKGSA